MLAVSGEMLDVLRAVLAPFDLDEDRSIHAIRGFRSFVHGFVSLEAAQGFAMEQSTDESFEFIVLQFIAGLDAARRGETSVA
jgi:hypothetical protein